MVKFKKNEVIFEYNIESVCYQLKAFNNVFELSQYNSQKALQSKSDVFVEVNKVYPTIEGFWISFTSNKNWFNKYTKINFHKVFIKHIISAHNTLLFHNELSYNEHKALYGWIRMCFYIKDIPNNMLAQYCSKCRKKVPYDPRYPKKICATCSNEQITDEKGVRVSFLNINSNGGLKILWWKNDKVVHEDSSQITKLCFINKVQYIASDHRFGGIVIQKQV
jgi:hypothetical protein